MPETPLNSDSEPDRLAQPIDAEQPPRLPFAVVGIGASAGGLEAVSEMLSNMRPDSGMAFVLIQHLPPDHQSMMAEILSRRTAMPVLQVEDGMPVEPNHVYVIRPGHVLSIRDGRLRLGERLGGPRAANRPVDDFFRSLAEEQRERAIGVIMSGMGSNGTAGAQAIKAVGGLCVAQDPETAQFPSMPRHLIDSGNADAIARPADIPEVLLGYAQHPYAQGGRESDAADVLRRERQNLRDILSVLRARTRHDFSRYKRPTLLRRIQRRMGLTRTETVSDYAKIIRQTPAEATALADDLLIHVTGFFRDPDAWEALQREVVAPLVAMREPAAPLRAWVTACSSGEEAYTLAMLLAEESERSGKSLDIKVFATDLAERSLSHARAGLYPGGIECEVSPERLARFFTREDEMYRVRPELRDKVVFASQNVLQDPPFSRIDVATCRNLLIYLEPEIQHRVLELLHFGLREGGALFLGSAETAAGAEELFEPLDKKARIYRRVGPTRHGKVEFPLPHALPVSEGGARAYVPTKLLRRRADGTRLPVEQLTQWTLLIHHSPAAVTVDRDFRILYYHGDTRAFLEQATGEPTRDLMLLTREGVRGAVRTALNRAAADNETAIATEGWVEFEPGRRKRVAVTASPVADSAAAESDVLPDWFVVSFTTLGAYSVETSSEPADGTEEMRRLRIELQSTIEELQTSNEELKASNEEVMSINEELQSANEELETSKEEMQSLNEELTTVNSQLRTKMEEQQAASSDLASLLSSTDLAVLFLDASLRIRRFTPAVRDLVEAIASDVGRPLSNLNRKFEDPHLDADCREVLERLVPAEREVAGAEGRHYLRRVTPYRTTENRIDGVVLTFVDITARRHGEEALRYSEDRLRMALDAAKMGIWSWDAEADVHTRDAMLNRLMGLDPVETSRPISDFLARIHPDDRSRVAAGLEASREGRPLIAEFRVIWPDGSIRWLRDQGGRTRGNREGWLMGAVVDVTDRRATEEQLRLVLASAVDFAIFTMDSSRRVTSWSPGAEAVLGWTAEEVIGRSCDEMFTAEDRRAGAPFREAEEARRNGRAADERWHQRKDGSCFFASGVLSRLSGENEGYVKVLRDLTHRKQMEDEHRSAHDELERRVAERTTELSAALDSLEAEMTRRRELARQLATSQEDERRRVARDLHDSVGQLLAALSLAVKAVETAGELPSASAVKLAEVQKVADALGREAHGLAVRLRPTALDDLGLKAALGQLVDDFSARTGVRAEFQVAGFGSTRLPGEIETVLYRVVQESLTNIVKHAKASHVSVVVTRISGQVAAVVEDVGAGFDPENAGRGRLGLVGMRERLELVGGDLEIESTPGSGTTIIARIPISDT